jgi:hypothetical protein
MPEFLIYLALGLFFLTVTVVMIIVQVLALILYDRWLTWRSQGD